MAIMILYRPIEGANKREDAHKLTCLYCNTTSMMTLPKLEKEYTQKLVRLVMSWLFPLNCELG